MSRPHTKNPTKPRVPQLRERSQGTIKIMQTYYRNGQIQEEQPRLKGRIHGVLRRWYKNGVLALEQPHENGVAHGICRQWTEDGKLLGSFKIKYGTGIHRHWHDNGQLQSEVSTVNGAMTGRHRSWLPDGTLVFEQYYLNNVPVDRHDPSSTQCCGSSFRSEYSSGAAHCPAGYQPLAQLRPYRQLLIPAAL